MRGSGVRPAAGLVLALALAAGCKFPALPDLPEDALAVDARTDAPARGPLVANGQAADLVLGQPSFGTNIDRGASAQSFQPEGISFADGRLWVSELGRHRVLAWDAPMTSDAPATMVLGQTSFATGMSSTVSASTFGQPGGVSASAGRLIVADELRNRALVWTAPPTAAGQAADLVLGQMTFDGATPGTGPGELRTPLTVWTDGSRAIVRGGFVTPQMWIWSTFPTANGEPADLQMLGGTELGAGTFSSTGGITSDGTRLVIADVTNNRVLVWSTFPTTSGQAADLVLGQPTFTSIDPGTGSSQMAAPRAVLLVDGALFVADADNDRVLVFDPLPTASGASATHVLGQSSASAVTVDRTPADTSLNQPYALAVSGDKLFVADRANRRVLRYDLALP